MIKPSIPENENERLEELYSFSILDTLTEEDYDSITKIASQICETSMSLISLIDKDRQWFKSSYGLELFQTERDMAFCAHAINQPNEVMVVKDATNDVRFFDNPYVVGHPYIYFYAGVPLVTQNGHALGTLCVLDRKAKELTHSQVSALQALSKQVVNLFELRKGKSDLEKANNHLIERQKELESFAVVAAHDLKSPLNNISMLTDVLTKEYKQFLDDDGQMFIDHLGYSASNLRKLIDGLLEYSRSDCISLEEKVEVDVKEFCSTLTKLFVVDDKTQLVFRCDLERLHIHPTSVLQILINLIANAIKYNDKDIAVIEVGAHDEESHYEFYVQDNGPGIAAEDHEKIFKIFTVNASTDKYGQKGNGIGLATVKKMVEKSKGNISVTSNLGVGTRFTFTIKK